MVLRVMEKGIKEMNLENRTQQHNTQKEKEK